MQPRIISLLWPVLVGLVWLRGCSAELYTAGSLRQYLQKVVTDAVTQHCGQGCPDGWTHLGTSCYFIPVQKLTWYQAHRACAVLDRRARLASVHPDNQQHVDEVLAAGGINVYIWLGLSKLPGNTEWEWSDGTALDVIDWRGREPYNAGGQEFCVVMYLEGWNDLDCTRPERLLCEIKLA